VFFYFLIQSGVVETQKLYRVSLISIEFAEHFDEDGAFERIHEFLEMDFFIHVEVLNEKINDGLFELSLILSDWDDEIQVAFIIHMEYFFGDEVGPLTGFGSNKLIPSLGHHPI
jgi:hypothetical protein